MNYVYWMIPAIFHLLVLFCGVGVGYAKRGTEDRKAIIKKGLKIGLIIGMILGIPAYFLFNSVGAFIRTIVFILVVTFELGIGAIIGDIIEQKLHPLNTLFANLLVEAKKDGVISDEELVLLQELENAYGHYEEEINNAVKGNMISSEESENIKELKKKIYEWIYETAMRDGQISEEEERLLSVFQQSEELDKQLKLIEGKVKSYMHPNNKK